MCTLKWGCALKVTMEGLSSNDILLLPTVAAQNAEESRVKMEKLGEVYKNQRTILEELTKEIPDLNEEDKSIKEKEETIKSLDMQIAEVQRLIIAELTESSNPQPKCSDILYDLLTSTQHELYELCEKSAEEGQSSTHITNLLNLENEITKKIGELSMQGKFPMTPEQIQEKRDATTLHNQKVVTFLNDLKNAEESE